MSEQSSLRGNRQRNPKIFHPDFEGVASAITCSSHGWLAGLLSFARISVIAHILHIVAQTMGT